MILIKEGVRFRKLIPELYNILPVLDMVFLDHGIECTITSANDGVHKPDSLHYLDRALDLRSHDLPSGAEPFIVHDLQQVLGLDYDVLFEDANTPNEHFHLEWDAK
jgi:hypothetical protein